MRWLWRIPLALAGLFAAWVLFANWRWGTEADIGAASLAKQVCSCHFVGGRDPDACRRDLGTAYDPLQWAVRDGGVDAWIPLLASRTARFHDGIGCTLE